MTHDRTLRWNSFIAAGVLASACIAFSSLGSMAQDDVTAIVADQVRSQGFPCDNASSAQRVEAESSPNMTVYLLKCDGATYRVVLVPDQAAQVTKAD